MKTLILLIALASISQAATSKEWYAAPDARSDGDGSIVSPWPLQTALAASGTIQPGDTVYLRGGTYRGPGFMSKLTGSIGNHITVRSYPGEWAVLTDGAIAKLLTALPATSDRVNNVLIEGSESWAASSVIQVGNEQLYPLRKNNPTNWYFERGWAGSTVTNHLVGEMAQPRANLLDHTGSYVMFANFEITCSATTNRIVGKSRYIGPGLNFVAGGIGNKAVNLVIHNVGHPAIGFWKQGDGGEINGCLIWGNGVYDNEGAWTRGSGVYAQNEVGKVLLKNNIVFRNFTYGMKGFGETGPVKGFGFEHNAVFGQPYATLEISSGSTPTVDNWMDGNLLLGAPMLSYLSKSNSLQRFVNNTIVGAAFGTANQAYSTYTNNTVFLPHNAIGNEGEYVMYKSDCYLFNDLNINWDYNTYYLGANSSSTSFSFRTVDVRALSALGGGRLEFSGDYGYSWQDWSQFDHHSTYKSSWPTNYMNIDVRRLDYDVNRWHVVVISTSGQTNVLLDLAALGFASNESYELRDAQNYFASIASGVYKGSGSISLPLNLVDVSEIRGSPHHYLNEHTNRKNLGLFNVFILSRISPPGKPKNLRVANVSETTFQ